MYIPSLWAETGSTLEKVVLAIAIGFIAGSIIMLYNKRSVGKLVRAIIERGANSPATAVTLGDLGVRPRGSLRDPASPVRRLIDVAPEKEGDPPNRRLTASEVSTARFYIPEENRVRAEIRYDAKNTTVPIVIIGIIAVGVTAYLCIRYIPVLLKFRPFGE